MREALLSSDDASVDIQHARVDPTAMGFFDRFRRRTRTTDDWSAFAGNEHQFFGLVKPFAFIRTDVEEGLRGQVPDTVVVAIRTRGTPRFLTLGKKTDDSHMIVSFFGWAVQAQIEATSAGASHTLEATITNVFGRVDERGHETHRSWIDLGPDAAHGYEEATFEARFLAFRAEHVTEPKHV